MTVASDSAGAELERRLELLSLEQKVRLLTGADFWALHAEPAVGLRRLVMSDGPAGVRGETWDERDTSANVPSPTALAASWDEDRVERLGVLLAAEARRKGVDVLLAPTVNLHRTPAGGRHFECLSEDPLLTGRIGAAFVRGLQSAGVAATVKHFVANDSETQRFTLDARIDDRVLRELYLAPFEMIVRDGGAWAVMAAYNGVNGTTMTESLLLRDVLKNEWEFDGVVMSDWFATRSTERAGRGGLDLAMPGPSGPWGDALVKAVQDGRVSETAVDDKVLRLLRLAARVGALEGVDRPGHITPAAPVAPAAIAGELRAAASAGMVLTRNDGLLPLDVHALRRVAVIGPNAHPGRTLGGGSATVFPPYTVSPLEGLRDALGSDVQVDHSPAVRSRERTAAASLDLLWLDDGASQGVHLRYLAADDSVLGHERRRAAAYTWMGAFMPGVPISEVAVVEVQTYLRAPTAGTYAVGVSGTGPFRLVVGDDVLVDGRLELPPGADPVEGVMRPPQVAGKVVLKAGDEVELILRHEPQAAAGFENAEIPMVSFQLNAEMLWDEDLELGRAVALAGRADVAVVVVGTDEEVESEGFDRETLSLPGRQDELVRAVVKANPRTVVVVNSGAPVLLPWASQVPSVLLAWFPGQEAGNALADVLLGVVEPGGRLPTTWPAIGDAFPSTQPVDGALVYSEGLHVGYKRYGREQLQPLYPFGHGLGYTEWSWVDLEAPSDLEEGSDLTLSARLRNTGRRAGRQVVQAYVSRPDSSVDRPVRWLAGFASASAEPGEMVSVEVTVKARAFQHWDVERNGWMTEPGTFVLRVGSSSADLPLALETTIGGGAAG